MVELEKHDDMKSDFEKSLAETIEVHANAMEGEKTRQKEEESKWRRALKESEKRALVNITQARADGSDEREGQLRLEMQETEEKQSAALQQINAELSQVSGDLKSALEATSSNRASWKVEFEKRLEQSAEILKRLDVTKRNEMKAMMTTFKVQQKQDREATTTIHQGEINGLLLKVKEQEKNLMLTYKTSHEASQVKNNELLLHKDQEQEVLLLSKLKEQALIMEAEFARGLKLEVQQSSLKIPKTCYCAI
jgi:hypothetical protein